MQWSQVPLGKLVEIKGGGTPSRKQPEFYDGDIPWATVKDLAGMYLSKTQEYISEEALECSAANLIPQGNIILCTRVGLGKVAINTIDVAINQDLKALFCCSALDSRYLLYYLTSLSESIQVQGSGATVKGITLEQVKGWNVPLPPISEQRRIVEILDQADALRKKRAESDKRAERILPALFIKMFGDPASWCEQENCKPLGKLVKIQGGGTPSKKNVDYWNGNIPWVSPKDMKQDILFDATDHISDKAVEESPAKIIDAGAVLIVVRGMILAHTIPVAIAGVDLTINQDMKALEPNSDEIDSNYLFSALKASSATLLAQVGTAGHGTCKLDTDDLLQTLIPIPSETDLKRFQNTLAIGRETIARIKKTQFKLEALFDTLLHRAFSGELTAEWRNAHLQELLQEMEHQAKALGIPYSVEYEQLGMFS